MSPATASTLKAARAYALYGGIAGLGAALGWPDNAPLNWKFDATIVFAVLTAWKALGTKPSKEPPAEGEQQS